MAADVVNLDMSEVLCRELSVACTVCRQPCMLPYATVKPVYDAFSSERESLSDGISGLLGTVVSPWRHVMATP